MVNEMPSRWFAAALSVSMLVSVVQASQVIYVDDDAPAGGGGSSWTDACQYVQDALSLASTAAKPVEIRVAQGLYKPDQGADVTPGDRAAAFQLLDGVVLKGGYAGVDAADPNVCDPERYETILSGDLKGDDIEIAEPNGLVWSPDEPTRADNSAHVVVGSGVDETAVIDGFVVTAGCGTSTAQLLSSYRGGGMLNVAGSARVLRCRFRDNLAFSDGGAVYNLDSAVAFSNCAFERNFSGSGGGAMSNENSRVVATDCTFTGQFAPFYGGAVVNGHKSSLSLKGCAFARNKSREGGAIRNYLDCLLDLVDCTFEGNRADWFASGGAIHSMADVTAVRCAFRNNLADASGGAIHVTASELFVSACSFTGNMTRDDWNGEGGAIFMDWDTMAAIEDSVFEGNAAASGGAVAGNMGHARITGCRFRNNSALLSTLPSHFSVGGGAIAAGNFSVMLTDCDLQGNRAKGGGAVRGNYFANLAFTNCILAGNRAERGGAIYTTGGNLRLTNCTLASNFGEDQHAIRGPGALEHCIVWDGGDLDADKLGVITAVYSDIEGGYPGQGNLDVDPLFVRPGRWADATDPNVILGPDDPNALWLAGDYHLQSQAGHWDQDVNDYVIDAATSPCIDAGDWGTPIGNEPFPNGGVLNLGAYGGTAQASKSYFGGPICETSVPGDINGDCKVDDVDTELSLQDWRVSGAPTTNQPPMVVITAPADGAAITVNSLNPTIRIAVEASDADGSVKQVSFSFEHRTEDGFYRIASVDTNGSDGWTWEVRFLEAGDYPAGEYTITVYAIDDDCEIAFASEVRITVIVTQ